MADALSPQLIWLDLEMTGLDVEHDTIIEIATLITDWQLRVVAEGPNIAIACAPTRLARMDSWNRSTHQRSGLVARVRASSTDLAAAESQTLDFLKQYVVPQTSPLCGNSVHQDRRFLSKYMPKLEAFFHYRNLDVSSVKTLARMWAPYLPEYDKNDAQHLAMEDIRASVAELAHWRRLLFFH